MPKKTQNRFTDFTSVSVTLPARHALRALSVDLSAVLGRRVPQSEALQIAQRLTFRASAQEIGDAIRDMVDDLPITSRDAVPPKTPDVRRGLPAA